MPFEGSVLTQTLLAFAMIAVLALMLRWTFGRERSQTTHWPRPGSDPETRGTEAHITENPATRSATEFPTTTPDAATPDAATTSSAPANTPDTVPPETVPPETVPPETVPPERVAPETVPPETARTDAPAAGGPPRDRRPGDRDEFAAAEPDDFGLLVPAAIVETAEDAARMRARLARARIRATAARGSDGRYRVLVFGSELHRARRVGGSST